MAFSLGDLIIKLGLDTSTLSSQATRASAVMNDLDRKIAGMTNSIVRFAVAAAGPAVFASLVTGAFRTIDSMEKLAFRLQSTVADVQTLRYAADLAGVSYEALAKSADMMTRRMAEAARTGTGPAAEALMRMGLNAKTLLSMPIDERMAVLADRFDKLKMSTAQVAETLRNFGIRGSEMVEVLGQGGEAIRKVRKDLEDFGVLLTGVDATKVVMMNDEFTRSMRVIEGVANRVAVALAPTLFVLAESFNDAAKGSRGFGEAIDQYVKGSIEGLIRNMVGFMATVTENRIRFDEMAKTFVDAVNAMIRKWNEWVSFFSLGMISNIPEMENQFGKLRETLKPPDVEEWVIYWNNRIKVFEEKAKEEAAKRQDFAKRDLIDQDSLNSEQRKRLEEKFLRFEAGLSQEQEALRIHYEIQLEQMKEFEDKRVKTAEDRARVRRKIEEKYAMDMLQLQARQYSSLASIVDSSLGHINEIMAGQGGAAFNIMKGISVATAMVKGFEAAVSAYAAGNVVGGPVVGAAFAAIAAAGSAALIAKIIATKPGSGTSGATSASVPSASGQVASAIADNQANGGLQPGAPAGGLQSTLLVQGISPGSLFSGEQVRLLAEKLLEYQNDGGKVVLQ